MEELAYLAPEDKSLTGRWINEKKNSPQRPRKEEARWLSVTELMRPEGRVSPCDVPFVYKKNSAINEDKESKGQGQVFSMYKAQMKYDSIANNTENNDKSLAELMDKRREEQGKMRDASRNRRTHCVDQIYDEMRRDKTK